MTLDFSDAFDSISTSYIITVLKIFHFPRYFIKWVEVLNADSNSCVSNYGHMTGWFPLGKGVRQGCPLSALLFVFSIELLACKIRQIKHIKGIDIFYNKFEFRLTQYADDFIYVKHITLITLLSIPDTTGMLIIPSPPPTWAYFSTHMTYICAWAILHIFLSPCHKLLFFKMAPKKIVGTTLFGII